MSHRPATAALANGASLESLREIVESAIEGDDVGPLVKAVFEVQPAGEQLPVPLTRDSESATTSQGSHPALGPIPQGNVLDTVLEMLSEVAEEKEAEIQQICRANAPEIAAAMHELGGMQRHTAGLRQQLQANNATLQAVGSSFAGRLQEVQEVAELQQGLSDARKAVGSALQVLLLCVKAAKYIEGKQLYKAYKTLETIQQDHGAALRESAYDARPLLPGPGSSSREGTPSKPGGGGFGGGGSSGRGGGGSSTSGAGLCGRGTSGAVLFGNGGGGGGGGDGAAEQLGQLAPFLRERVAELAVVLEQRAIADFNNWLSNVRAQARTIGMRAVRWAAAERQHEEQLTRQRKLLLPRLEGLQDVRQAGAMVAQSLRAPGVGSIPPSTPLQLPAALATPPRGGGGDAAGPATPAAAAGSSTPPPPSSSGSGSSATAARFAAFKAARQAASSPTRAGSEAASAAAAAAGDPPGPGTAASSSRQAAAAAAAHTPVPQQQQQEQAGALQRSDTLAVTGDLLDGVDMASLHRCVHIHACLGRLPQFAEYYARNRRQQLASDLVLQGGDSSFLEQYQSYLTQLVGYFLVEDAAVQQQQAERGAAAGAAAAAEEHLDIVGQVDAAWDAAVAALKAVLEPAFRGATAASAMLTVKDFILLACLALDHCGYQTVAVREMLLSSRAKYHELLGASTAAAVQAAVSGDSLAQVEVKGQGRADELLRQLALPITFHAEDAGNKQPPFKAPFTAMVPELVKIIRGHIVDSVAYLKGLLTAGEVLPAARQYRDRMLSRIVAAALQARVDAAAGNPALPVTVALQLVANVAALMCAAATLDDFALAQARGETPETQAAAAAAAAAGSRSPSPGRRSRSRSPVKPAAGGAAAAGSGEQRGRQQPAEGAAAAGAPAEGNGGGSSSWRSSRSRGSSHGSAPSPPGSPSAAAAAAAAASPLRQQAAGSQQSGHTVLSFSAAAAAAAATASSGAPAAAGGAGMAGGGAAAAFLGLLASAEALVVQAVAARAAGMLAEGEELEWAPSEQARSTSYSPYIDQLILYLKECASLVHRMAPDASVVRMLRGVVRYLADAVMLQLMSDAVPAFNIFGIQRLFSDLGGISRAAGSMGVPGLADELAEPLLFCEMMVFGSLEELLTPEQRAGKYGALNLRRVLLVLDKYCELDKASGFAGMHKSKQAERFISRKTVDRVLKELRADLSRSASRASSSSGSFTAGGGGGMRSTGGSFSTIRSG